ncbi:hypothetical protein B0H63DRAFT_520768 [Podospora didyma]|uniref:Uncharacterized protein n=1 Tax=Podospora didyma TaxID=330526 RepID=A0AAE0NS97_9PEZI|nr:hypothetical protein B0H63DRAFT_520768 [Podospora didyma]
MILISLAYLGVVFALPHPEPADAAITPAPQVLVKRGEIVGYVAVSGNTTANPAPGPTANPVAPAPTGTTNDLGLSSILDLLSSRTAAAPASTSSSGAETEAFLGPAATLAAAFMAYWLA